MGSACTRSAVQVAAAPLPAEADEVVPSGAPAQIARAPQGKVTLLRAVKKNDLAAARELLTEKAELDKRGMFGNTPLLSACAEGYAEMALLLLDAGADVKARNDAG